MELDDFKKNWQNIQSPALELAQLEEMIKEKNHPVLSSIKKQLIGELAGWAAFLLVCFTGLDVEQKPLFATVILVLSIALPMLFNVYGYQLSKDVIAGPNIRASLLNRIKSLKRFAIGTAILRILLITGVGYFFISTVALDKRRLILITAGLAVLIIPLYLLARIWLGRITKLTATLNSLS